MQMLQQMVTTDGNRFLMLQRFHYQFVTDVLLFYSFAAATELTDILRKGTDCQR